MKPEHPQLKIGTKIEAIRPGDPYFKKIRGIISGFSSQHYQVTITEAVPAWSNFWEPELRIALSVKGDDITSIIR